MFTGIWARPGKAAQNEAHALIPPYCQATWTPNWELQDYDYLILLCAFPLAFFPVSKPQLCLMFLSAKREPWTSPPTNTVLLGYRPQSAHHPGWLGWDIWAQPGVFSCFLSRRPGGRASMHRTGKVVALLGVPCLAHLRAWELLR